MRCFAEGQSAAYSHHFFSYKGRFIKMQRIMRETETSVGATLNFFFQGVTLINEVFPLDQAQIV